MAKVVSKAPTRVDLAGGTLDIRPLTYVLEHKATVNIGITLFAEVTIETRDQEFIIESLDQGQKLEGPFDQVMASNKLPLIRELLAAIWQRDWPALQITTKAGSPAGAGLGGSSCLAVAVASALFRLRCKLTGRPEPDEALLVRFVQDIEARLIHCPTGCQDYWGAVRGGLNLISFPPGDAAVETLRMQELEWLQERILLCYSGVSRASGQNNWDIFKRVFDRDSQLINRLNQIGKLAEDVTHAVRQGKWQDALDYSREEWMVRRALWPAIETLETKNIDEASRSAGAWFSRVCGAGGGGVMAIFCEPSLRGVVAEAAKSAGGQILEAKPTNEGLLINDNGA
ncbi:MAG: hypothetical protein ACOH5I_04920 [Oligoflexus sp.]